MRSEVSSPDHALTRMLDRLAPLLPAQGPISIFIHHNTLHAFEGLPFEEAVERAARRLHREPYLSEARYREKHAAGRILDADLDAVIADALGATASDEVVSGVSRADVWRAVVRHGLPSASGAQLDWLLQEAPVAAPWGGDGSDDRARRRDRLWRACLEAAGRTDARPPRAASPGPRH